MGGRFLQFLKAFLTVLLICSCSPGSTDDPKLEKMDQTVRALSKALQEPGLHALVQSIEDMEYTTSNTLDVLFSVYGASYWPPPGAGLHSSEAAELGEEHIVELLPVVREKPSGKWQVVIIAESDRFLLRGYGESPEKPLREESVEFPTPTTEKRLSERKTPTPQR